MLPATSSAVATYPDLAGKVVLVTGASKGIGRAIAEAFVQNDADVTIVGRSDREALDTTVRELGPRVHGELGDLAQSSEADRIVGELVGRAGRIDILVNNAGGFPARTPMLEIGDDVWRQIVDLNVTTAFNCCRAAVPAMPQGGAIVSVGSEAGRNPPWVTGAHYAASKAALSALSRHLAKELGVKGIRSNLVIPGGTMTARYASLGLMDEVHDRRMRRDVPLARHSTPNEQAAAIVFLASASASYITGQVLTVNGGKSMGE
jgi:3-oxoacyl-[acyl-carrier protein] reductase